MLRSRFLAVADFDDGRKSKSFDKGCVSEGRPGWVRASALRLPILRP